MENWLKQVKENFNKVWQNLSKAQKITLIGISVASISIIIFLAFLNTRVIYEPLFTELESKDAAVIKEYLDKKAIKYRITQNGSAIEVDKNAKYGIRLDISKEGLMPTNGTVGFEIFDSAKIGATEFDKKMMYLRAQKGELERTIGALEAVKKASVSITPANNSPFAEEKEGAKASVLIQLEPTRTLNEESIKSIVILVSNSIEGLSPEDVNVVDTGGNILSDRIELSENNNVVSKKRIDFEKEIVKNLEKNANGVLNVLGSGNFRVKISVELDYDKEVSTQETFTTPTVNGEQLQQGLVRSNQSKGENSKSSSGTGDIAEGVAGTETNIPEYVAPENQNSNSEYNKNENITNFELDKKNSSYEKSLGQIKRMTISIALNKDSSYFKDKEVSAEDKAQFQKIVETAVGFNSRRGDIINVEVIPFNRDLENQIELAAQREAQRLRIIYGSTAGIILLLVLIIIGYGVFRAMEARKLRLQEAKAIEELLPQLEEFELEDKVSVEDQERMDQENQIKLIAKQRPDEVAALIKNWLSEE